MPTDFKNVNEITQQVMDIVKPNPNLKDVWIQGGISEVSRAKNGTLNFTLTDYSEKIECVIFNDRALLQEDLPAVGSDVSVKGEIYVYETRSEYRFMVTEINLSENLSPAQSVSVSAITNTLQDTLKTHSGKVQGKISEVFVTPAGFTILRLKDVTADGQPGDIIECVLPPGISPSFSLQKGERVNFKGQFGIFAKARAYRIEIDDTNNITHVTEQPTQDQTTPNECQECGQRCKPPRQLCPMCYYAQLDNEGIVVGTVMRFFNGPKFSNFTSRREHPILLIGTIEGRADVVLLNSSEEIAAIAECKSIGYGINNGREQLESYLFASKTKLGLFADDTDPFEWTFLKRNDERDRYDQISRSQFERDLGVEPVPDPTQTRLELILGNIIEAEVDAIVNAANSQLTRGSGVDGAIRDAGGEEIDSECREIIDLEGVRPPGRVIITTGGNLHARHVIHAVGPIWDGGEQYEAETLARCYKNSLKIAVENGIRSIAFPAISTGNFGYPIEKATPIALNAVKEFVEQAQQNNEMVPEHIQFVLSNEEFYNCYVKEFSTLGLGLSCFIG